MTYFIHALQRTPARLCVSTTKTDSKAVSEIVKAHYESLGYETAIEVEA